MGIRQNGAYTVQDDLAHSRCFINVSLLHTHPPALPPSTLPQQLSSSMLQPYETPKFKSSALISLLNSRLVYPTADLASLLGCLSSIPDLTVPQIKQAFPRPAPQTNHLHLRNGAAIHLNGPTQRCGRRPASPTLIITPSPGSVDCCSYTVLEMVLFSTSSPSHPRFNHHHFQLHDYAGSL